MSSTKLLICRIVVVLSPCYANILSRHLVELTSLEIQFCVSIRMKPHDDVQVNGVNSVLIGGIILLVEEAKPPYCLRGRQVHSRSDCVIIADAEDNMRSALRQTV